MAKPVDNITRKLLRVYQHFNKIKGLATECRTLCLSLGLPSLMAKDVTKNNIRHAIKTKIKEECIKRMQEGMNLMQRQFGPELRRRDEVKFLGEIKITTL